MIAALGMFIMACGGGGSPKNNGNGPVVTGMAAAGAPVVGTVNVRGANSKVSYSAIRADGSFTVDVAALTEPFIIFVEGHVAGKSVRLYSAVDEAGYVNVTPATTMVMAVALGADPATVYPPAQVTDPTATLPAPPEQDDLDRAQEKVKTLLAEVFAGLDVPATFDLMNGTFTANGTGFDKVMDVVELETGTELTVSNKATGEEYYSGSPAAVQGMSEQELQDAIPSEVQDDIENVSDDLLDMRALVEKWISLQLDIDANDDGTKNIHVVKEDEPEFDFNPADKAKLTDELKNIYAADYLDNGMNLDDAIEYQLYDDLMEIQEFIITNPNVNMAIELDSMTVIGPAEPVNLSQLGLKAGSIHITSNSTTLDYTLGNQPWGGKGRNYQVMKCLVAFKYIATGSQNFTETETGVVYFVQESQGSEWKLWGNRQAMWVGTWTFAELNRYRSGDKEQRSRCTGIGIDVEDEGSIVQNRYGDHVILITGDGITASLGDAGNGVFAMKEDSVRTDYRKWNLNSWTPLDGQGLDVSLIKNLEYTYTLCTVSGTNLTPVTSWTGRIDSKPFLTSELTDDIFPVITSPASPFLEELELYSLPWGINVSWEIPEGPTGGEDRNLSISYDGSSPYSSYICERVDDMDIDSRVGSRTITIAQDDTAIRALNSMMIKIEYQDAGGRTIKTNLNMWADKPYYISGTFSFGQEVPADKNIFIFADDDNNPDNGVAYSRVERTSESKSSTSYYVQVAPGDYYVIGWVDMDGNGSYNAGDIMGYYMSGTVPARVEVNGSLSDIPITTTSE